MTDVNAPIMQPSDRPIFVVGCPRSGTTLFRVMLHAHPRIALPPENQYVMPAYHRRAKFKDLTVEKNRQRLADWITQRPDGGFHCLQLDGEKVAREIVDGATLGTALGIPFRDYAQKFDKERWGDKRPPTTGSWTSSTACSPTPSSSTSSATGAPRSRRTRRGAPD
jgi:hypothetical protein